MVDSFTLQNILAPKGPSAVANRAQNKPAQCELRGARVRVRVNTTYEEPLCVHHLPTPVPS